MTNTNHQRPLVDFSGTSRATAREYAADLNSRVLKPNNAETLTRVAEGRKVDAYEVNAAVLDAMRSVATRFGQSMQRREYTRRAAYLGHIVQAVLEAAADDLPSYTDGGVRSRKIEEQATEIEGLRERVTTLNNERGSLTQAASDERRRLVAEIEREKKARQSLTEQANAEIDRIKADLAAKVEEQSRIIEGLTEDLTRHVALREYVEGHLLDAQDLAAVAGFTHGYVSGQRD